MPILTQQFLITFKDNLRAITEASYQGKLKNLRYQRFTKVMTSESENEILSWLLSTAMLRRNGQGGNIRYGTLGQVKQSYRNGNFNDGLVVFRNQIEDLDGRGVQVASEWNRQIGADIAYFPQREVVTQLLNGETGTCYDALPFFSKLHPVNPLNPGSSLYANIFTGAVSGAYPGALPIDESVSVDVALSNINKALAYISGIKMPNGVDPRFLTVNAILHPPKLRARVQQLTNARFIAQAATGGAGSGDVSAVVTDQALGDPICMAELGASQTYPLDDSGATTISGDDTSYYLLCQERDASELGAMVWINREPVSIQFFSGLDGSNVELAEARKMKWIAQGRATAGYGLPYFLFKVKAT